MQQPLMEVVKIFQSREEVIIRAINAGADFSLQKGGEQKEE